MSEFVHTGIGILLTILIIYSKVVTRKGSTQNGSK